MAAFQVHMNWTAFLKNELELRQKENSRYSLRAFAQFLKMSPAHLSKILAGKKLVSAKVGLGLSETFGLSATETLYLMKELVDEEDLTLSRVHVLDGNDVKQVCNWIAFAIMGLSELRINQANAEWIAAKLKISKSMAQQVFDLLLEKKYLRIENGQFRRTIGSLRTQAGVPSALIRRHQRVVMQLAGEKMESVSMDYREFGSYMVAIHRNRIPAAKKMIRKFLDEFCREFSRGNKTDVVSIGIQMFPVTDTQSERKKREL